MKLFFILVFMTSLAMANPPVSVQSGTVIRASDINSLQSQLTQVSEQINTLKNTLDKQTLVEEFLLWEGNMYVDGSSNYVRWNSSQHQAWDEIEFHVSYDSGAIPEIVRIKLPSNYAYGTHTQANSFLFTTYSGEYRRITINTTGFRVFNGEGGGWHLRRVVGIKKKVYTK